MLALPNFDLHRSAAFRRTPFFLATSTIILIEKIVTETLQGTSLNQALVRGPFCVFSLDLSDTFTPWFIGGGKGNPSSPTSETEQILCRQSSDLEEMSRPYTVSNHYPEASDLPH